MVTSRADAALVHDVGHQACVQAMRSFMTALELIPDGELRFAAMRVGSAYLQMKIDGFRLLMPEDHRRNYDEMLEIVRTATPVEVAKLLESMK